MKQAIKLDWRIIWYAVLIWLLSNIIGGFVILPWFYLVLPIAVIATTVYFFKNIPSFTLGQAQRGRGRQDGFFAMGLWVSIFWFAVLIILNILQIIGPYYFNILFYFSDLRNWFLYSLILLTPVVCSLIFSSSGQLKKYQETVSS